MPSQRKYHFSNTRARTQLVSGAAVQLLVISSAAVYRPELIFGTAASPGRALSDDMVRAWTQLISGAAIQLSLDFSASVHRTELIFGTAESPTLALSD